jgi:hypothetical protein
VLHATQSGSSESKGPHVRPQKLAVQAIAFLIQGSKPVEVGCPHIGMAVGEAVQGFVLLGHLEVAGGQVVSHHVLLTVVEGDVRAEQAAVAEGVTPPPTYTIG